MNEKQLISEAMKRLRARVKPENCARDPRKARRAQRASVKARKANQQTGA